MVAAEKPLGKPPELISRERREIRKLGTLVEVGRILADTNNLKTGLELRPGNARSLPRYGSQFRNAARK